MLSKKLCQELILYKISVFIGNMKYIENKIQLIENSILMESAKKSLIEEAKKIGIEKLPYSYSALKNFIDAETMDVHYNKHYKGYVKKLNDALSKKDYGDVELENIIKRISKYNRTIRNNAGGAFNHALFWKMLSPKEQECNGLVLKKINQSFGSLKEFKSKFEYVATKRFGSGWVWLVLTKRNTLKIISTANQDNPLMNVIKNGGFPILGLDLWEHAYYLKYQNKRDEYIKNFWKSVNWEFVNELLETKTKTKLNEETSIKQILAESTKEYCDVKEISFYRTLFNTNKYVRNVFKFGIDKVLAEVFPDNYYEKNEYGPNQMKGIYDFETQGRSVINKINTNYFTFCILVGDINKVLSKQNVELISFKNKTVKQQIEEVQRMMEIIKEYQSRIFSIESSTFEKIMNALTEKNKKGEENEDLAIEKLKTLFGDDNVEKIGGLGNLEDAISGIDCKITKDGKVYTAQIKPFGRIEDNNGVYKMIGTGGVKNYKTDYLIFVNNSDGAYIFDNSNTQVINGVFEIPTSNLVKHIY